MVFHRLVRRFRQQRLCREVDAVMTRTVFAISATVLALEACSESSPSLGPQEPAGPAPSVRASVAFGESPLEGFLYLTPDAETRDWPYTVDLDGDGVAAHEGLLNREIGFGYRFVTPGIYRSQV